MTSQYGAYALHAGLARLHARIRMNTPTRPGTHIHARKHTHRDKKVIFIASPRQQCFANAPQCYVIRTLPFKFLLARVCLCKTQWQHSSDALQFVQFSDHCPYTPSVLTSCFLIKLFTQLSISSPAVLFCKDSHQGKSSSVAL